MMPYGEECYQGESFWFSRRWGSAPAECQRERCTHAVRLETTEPATVSLFPAGCQFSARGRMQTGELILELAPRLLEKSLGERSAALELQRRENIRDPRIQHLMLALLEELRDGRPGDSLYAVSLVTAISIHLARHYSIRLALPSQSVMPRARLNRVLAIIEERADENLRLAELAETAGMSMYHFAKLFKQTTGKSPHQYALARRMEKAKQLLLEEDTSVLEISVRTGFIDQRHFTKVFRRFTGFTPTAYRAVV